MTKIADELQANAARLRARAKRVEAAWKEARHIKRIVRVSAEAKASKRAERKAAKELERHRDRQSGLRRPASAVRRIIKPE